MGELSAGTYEFTVGFMALHLNCVPLNATVAVVVTLTYTPKFFEFVVLEAVSDDATTAVAMMARKLKDRYSNRIGVLLEDDFLNFFEWL
jgi:hypothetical protein